MNKTNNFFQKNYLLNGSVSNNKMCNI